MQNNFSNVSENEMNEAADRELIKQAQAVARNAYAPYSNFRVGAAVLGEHGTYRGTNVENSSWGLSLCAERAALSAAVAAGESRIVALAVACVDASEDGPAGALMPCGACRQWIAELAPQARILVAGDLQTKYQLSDLLPNPFRLR